MDLVELKDIWLDPATNKLYRVVRDGKEELSPPPAAMTASEILTALKTVDGSGSGLDADLLDGKNSGNASGDIPISNGTVNTNLNADLLDGYNSDADATASTIPVRDSSGRMKAATPSATNDVAIKSYVDGFTEKVSYISTNHGTSIGTSVTLPALTVGEVSILHGYGRKSSTSATVNINLPAGGTYTVGGLHCADSPTITHVTSVPRIVPGSNTIAGGTTIGSIASVGVSYYLAYSVTVRRVS